MHRGTRDYRPTTVSDAYGHRPASDRIAEVYELAGSPGRFAVRLELHPEHSDNTLPGALGWWGGRTPYGLRPSAPLTELEAMTIGAMWECYGILPDTK